MTANFAVPAALPVTLPITGRTEVFPVGTIYCAGHNYADHALEMGQDPDREAPVFFIKSAASLTNKGLITYPPQTEDLQHEVELVVAIGSDAREISVEAAPELIFGYAVGLDMTRRDRQREAKASGRPWDVAKSFPDAAVVTNIVQAEDISGLLKGRISLSVNGEARQDGELDQMIWGVPEQIAHLSRTFGLKAGDLIFTGTPAGVGAVGPGDVIVAEIDDLARLEVRVV